MPFSCRRGECGCCRVRVLEGRHRRLPYQALGTPYPLAEDEILPVSYTHLTLPTIHYKCRSRGSPEH
nr:2Fe-2S iron-sulfur cluster-binding protein [Herbaspirillum sp. ASV7]